MFFFKKNWHSRKKYHTHLETYEPGNKPACSIRPTVNTVSNLKQRTSKANPPIWISCRCTGKSLNGQT